jgi:error-prone DNA polymerase
VTGYAELQVTSNYSFLCGASHVEELLAQAKLLNLPAITITDRNTLAGLARAHHSAEEAGIGDGIPQRAIASSRPSG